MHSIGSRLKVWREALSLTQAEAAAKLSLPGSTYQNYERDVRAPNMESVVAFIKAGISTNWLLTGNGPMLAKDATAPGGVDRERLVLAIEATEEGLRAAGREMKSDKKADLVMAVYELLEESGVSKERVLKLVQLAA